MTAMTPERFATVNAAGVEPLPWLRLLAAMARNGS